MTSSRKIKRNKEKQAKKEIKKKMSMFGRLPDECSSCLTPFDKKNREMVDSWSVVVREKEKVVRLYCPDCWAKARKFVEEYHKEQKETNE